MPVQVLYYFQDGCMGCMEQEAINREVTALLGIEIEARNAVERQEEIRTFGLKVTPTLLIVVDGEVRERFEGVVHAEALEAAIKKYPDREG
ncbi:thioredoxin [Methanofollis formosanus]|uniref:Thioredoxin n=1 Tax=Methanofollis formosanus TaxID=299308 RepID=A0A8G1A1I0_9EURY|nr:thioredoxin family protein [Methanofollis formosanus]QYZ78716.1 thioredoxin [Methanofollis formosanus]